jgi:hypothetical protein
VAVLHKMAIQGPVPTETPYSFKMHVARNQRVATLSIAEETRVTPGLE